MNKSRVLFLVISFILVQKILASDKLVIVIIDGARYSETLGDPEKRYVPKMDSLSHYGALIDYFENDSMTWTSRAIPALWCGTWTEVENITWDGVDTKFAVKPTIFEYYRKHLNKPAEDCVYVIKELSSLWLASFDPDYGPDYWPQYHSAGHTDAEVAAEAESVIHELHPNFLLVYLADVDSYGHSGVWEDYTSAIAKADSIVGRLWHVLQDDPFYQDQTTLFVTNDHGRHDGAHGGFKGHGDGCPGCRHIEFLAIGPRIKTDYVSPVKRRIPDMTVTAGHLMGFETPKATGEVMEELLKPQAIDDTANYSPVTARLKQNYPNPFNPETKISFTLNAATTISLTVYDVQGRRMATLADGSFAAGTYDLLWDGMASDGRTAPSGIYFYRLLSPDFSITRQMLLLR